MFEIERFDELAGFFEYDEGMSRFQAEERAATRLNVKRWEAMNAIRKRDSERGGNIRQTPARQPADNLPGMQPTAAQQGGQMPIRNVSNGRGDVVLSSLSGLSGRGVLR